MLKLSEYQARLEFSLLVQFSFSVFLLSTSLQFSEREMTEKHIQTIYISLEELSFA